jgi:cell division protein FtsB
MSRRKKKSFFSVFRKDKQSGNEGGDLVSRLSNTDQQFRRILFRLLVVLVLVFLGYAFFGGTNGFIHIAKLQMKKKELARENQELLVKLIDADITRSRLKNDLNYIEYIARTRHLLSRPGEVIYRFKE